MYRFFEQRQEGRRWPSPGHMILCSIASFLMMGVPIAAQVTGPGTTMEGPKKARFQPPPPTAERYIIWRSVYSPSVFDSYMAILSNWTESPGWDEVEKLAELEVRLRRVPACRKVQEQALSFIRRDEPGSVFSTFLLDVYVWQAHLENRRFFFVPLNLQKMIDNAHEFARLKKVYPEGRREAVVLLTYLAEIIWDSGHTSLLGEAERVLSEALKLDSEYVPARYLRSMVTERLSQYRKTLRDTEVLAAQLPLRRDITLRLAVQLARLGQAERAVDLFSELTPELTSQLTSEVSASEEGTSLEMPWVRTVAFQEWVRLEIDRNRLDEAMKVLDRARAEDPANARLLTMEIDLQRRDHHQPSPRSASLLGTWFSDLGVTPRLRYLQGPLPELRANQSATREIFRQSAPLLAEAVQNRIAEKLGVSADCARHWRNLKPPVDPPPPLAPAPVPLPPPSTIFSAVPTASISPPPSTIRPRAGSAGESVAGSTFTDPATGETYVIHDAVDLDLQSIYVTPTRFGNRVPDFRKDEITVIDAGKRQEIVTFAQGEIPFTATLLIDASGSMQGPRLQHALEGSRAFITAMGPDDRTRLVMAADRLRGVSPFVSSDGGSREVLESGLDMTDATGGTALYDHLFLTLDAMEPELGRKVVIVLSDGFDLMSVVPMDSIRSAIKRSQTQLYWVRLREGLPRDKDFMQLTGWRTVGASFKEVMQLERAVFSSGGRVVEIDSSDEVGEAFAEIVAELRNQIAIGYYPNPSHEDGRWRKVQVKSKRFGVNLRHGAGYFDGSPATVSPP